MYQQPPNNQPPNTYYPPQQPYQQPWQPPMMPPPPPPKRPNHSKRNAWLIIGVILFFVVLFAVSRGNTGSSSPSVQATSTTDSVQATDTPVPTDTPAPTRPPAKWTTTHTFTGTGEKTTATFATSGDWKLIWTAQAPSCCEAFFGASVYGSDKSLIDSGTDATIPAGKKGTDSTEEHTGAGSFYLKVYAGVPWTIQIQELK